MSNKDGGKKRETTHHVAVRLDPETIKRIEAFAERIRYPGCRTNRSTAVQVLVTAGLEEVEEHGLERALERAGLSITMANSGPGENGRRRVNYTKKSGTKRPRRIEHEEE